MHHGELYRPAINWLIYIYSFYQIGSPVKNQIEKGIEKGKFEVATNLLRMNISVEKISQATGLYVEDIEDLKKEI